MFHAEINRTLTAAVNLMNTSEGRHSAKPASDQLTSIESLRKYLTSQDSELKWPSSNLDRAQVDKVRELRALLHQIWGAAPITSTEPVERINALLEGVGTRVVRTSGGEEPQFRSVPIPVSTQLADVMTAVVADALQFMVVNDETGRMRTCRGDDCDAVIVDLTRNRSKLFCDFGNCANRAHVRAYRARQAALREAGRRALAGDGASEAKDKLTKPSAAEKAAQIEEPTSESAIAAKEFRDRMRDELLEKRDKKDKKSKKKKDKKKAKK
ncbi:CGNR zinc finger domain-containing protein [Nesterenkonia xinjiangensis]|uniref:Putative RNA-binding Zn ribbon-like protein n=1 Tax=Nesterenkonia xinjiangensis TaxID=225327 RepID=A0A7Z0KA03_9MICC|nr:CGNR zinc finger domain-containing protein [Nesterenkonia xinjiangensis]NYJ77780.1 putative RNA-binding Zn ribbon-like protein [Nesterenkonia xinjiangensis]